MHDALQVSWPGLSAIHLRAGLNTGQQLILLEGEGDEQPELELDLPASVALLARRGVQPLIGQPWIEEEVAGRRYRISARSFFHTNTAAAEAMQQVVLDYAQAGPLDTVVDAYCGAGFLTLPLAELAGKVIGIDSSPDALEDLAVNAGDMDNVEAHEGAVEEVAPALLNQGQSVAILVLDPPRAGAGPGALSSLLALAPRRVVYVSADPAALARDAVHLAAAGYRLVEVQPVDLSPQTFQVQSVGLFTA